MRRVLKPIVCLPLLLLGHFFVQRAESQPLRMGYSGLGIGADDLSRVMEKEKVWQKHGLDVKAIYFALALPHRKVVVLDGDGNLLFNLASLADLCGAKSRKSDRRRL